MIKKRLVIRFCCGGLLRFLSHQETVTAIERTIRRSKLPVTYTQGFHPRVKTGYSQAVPTGVASFAHYVFLETETEVSDPVKALNFSSCFTLKAQKAWYIPSSYTRIDNLIDSYRLSLTLPKERYIPDSYDSELKVSKKTKGGYKEFRAGDVFKDLTVTPLRTVYMVKYSQPIDSMVSAEEILKIFSKDGTASYEGVFVFVEEALVKGKRTSDILDEIGGIRNVWSQ